MAQTRFTGTLTTTDEPACQSHARVTIIDSEGTTARGCPRHAVAALNGFTGAHVDWADSKGLNQWERQALELAEERSKLTPRPCNQRAISRSDLRALTVTPGQFTGNLAAGEGVERDPRRLPGE